MTHRTLHEEVDILRSLERIERYFTRIKERLSPLTTLAFFTFGLAAYSVLGTTGLLIALMTYLAFSLIQWWQIHQLVRALYCYHQILHPHQVGSRRWLEGRLPESQWLLTWPIQAHPTLTQLLEETHRLKRCLHYV